MTTKKPLTDKELASRIVALEADAAALDRLHSQNYRFVGFVDPTKGRAVGRSDGSTAHVLPTPEDCRRMRPAVEIRERFFSADAELHELRGERARRSLAALPDEDALKDEIAAAGEAMQRAKAAYHAARANLFRLTAASENTRVRRTELVRAIDHDEAEAVKSRARAARHAQELSMLAPFAPTAESAR